MYVRTTDAITKEVLEPITFVLAYPTVYIYIYIHIFPKSLNLTETISRGKVCRYESHSFTAGLHQIKVRCDYSQQWPYFSHQTSGNDATVCMDDGNWVQGESCRNRLEFITLVFGQMAAVLSVVSRLRSGRPRNLGSIPERGKGFLMFKRARPVLWSAQPLTQQVTVALCPGLMQPRRKAD